MASAETLLAAEGAGEDNIVYTLTAISAYIYNNI